MNESGSAASLGPVRQAALVVGAYVVGEVVLVALAYLWVFVYSVTVDSGGDQAYYEAYAQVSSPVVAVVFAGPVFFAIARWIRRRWPVQASRLALSIFGLNAVIGVLTMVFAEIENLAYPLTMVVLATATMTVGTFLGARSRR